MIGEIRVDTHTGNACTLLDENPLATMQYCIIDYFCFKTLLLYTWLTNSFSTKKCTVLQLCSSLRISSYMFQINCHHLGAYTYIAKPYSDEILLQYLSISNVQIIVKICNIKKVIKWQYDVLLIMNCYTFIVVFIDYNCLPAFRVCMLHVLSPLTLILMYLHMCKCWNLHISSKHIAALLLSNFSLMFL